MYRPMKKTNEISIVDNKRVGILKVKYDGDTFAIFNYCREGDEKEQCYPFYEFELVEETEHEVFVRYTRDEAIILFNYQPVLRIPTRYKLGDQEVDMCEEVVDWANQIVEDLNEHVILPAINKTKNEKEKK